MNFTIPKEIRDKFSSRALTSISLAVTTSEQFKNFNILPIHLLYGIYKNTGSIGSNLLKSYGFPFESLATELKNVKKVDKKNWKPVFHPLLKNALKKAILASEKARSNYVGTEHLLFAIVSQNEDRQLLDYFEKLEFPITMLQEHLLAITTQTPKLNEVSKVFETLTKLNKPGAIQGDIKTTPAIDSFSQNLTLLAKNKKLSPTIGRTRETERMIHILHRKKKNNPILVGEAGVGKTAIVEGLAQKIINKKVPYGLSKARIVSLNLANILASTTFRGDFEARIKKILEEVEKNKNTIIFIDEIHTLIGAGASSGQSMDAANMLKPALTQENFKVIGATTPQEYFKYIEKDSALSRRFQKIEVKEPNEKETLKILSGLQKTFENYYNIELDKKIFGEAISLSKRYIHDRNFPDKVIDIIDETGARAASSRKESATKRHINKLKKQEEEIIKKKELMVNKELFEDAKKLKEKAAEIKKKFKQLEKKAKKEEKDETIKITENHLIETISEITDIPVTKLKLNEKDNFKRVRSTLNKRIVGQEEIINKLISTIKRYKAGIGNQNRPIGSFIFLGPSGVGKTETAKVLAESYFGKNRINSLKSSSENFIRIDMTEFTEKHQISRLIGAPAGYVGYEESGELINKIKRNPYSVVLFDEIEKANSEVIGILMQILEDGVLTSAQGEKVYFNNALIILTSNIGSEELIKEAETGFKIEQENNNERVNRQLESNFEKIKDKTITELKRIIKPELINRIDEILVFKPLNTESIEKIVKLQFTDLKAKLKKEFKLNFNLDKSALAYLTDKAIEPEFGARPVRRVLQNEVENLIAEEIIDGKILTDVNNKKRKYSIKYIDGKLVIV